jgi:hypothetical protein
MSDGVSHLCHTGLEKVARPAGLEPATPGLEGQCSIQLSYGRVILSYRNPNRQRSSRRVSYVPLALAPGASSTGSGRRM